MTSPIHSRLKSSAFIVWPTKILVQILALVKTIYLSKILGPANFGLFTLAIVTTFFLELLLNKGIEIHGARSIAKNPSQIKEFFINIIGVRFLLAIFIYFTIFITLQLFPQLINSQLRELMIISALMIFSNGMTAEWLLQGQEKFLDMSLVNVVKGIVSLILVITLVQNASDLQLAIFATLFGSIAAMLFTWFKTPSGTFINNYPNLNKGFSEFYVAMPMGIATIFAALYTFSDNYLLAIFENEETVGYYRLANRLQPLIVTLPNAIVRTYFPYLSKKEFSSDSMKSYFRFIIIVGIIGLSFALLVSIFSPVFIPLVFGKEYIPSIIISQILAWKMGLTCIGFALAMTLQAWEKEMYHLKVVAIAAIINIVANIIFIPKFGVNAAAITAVICEAIVIFLFSYIVIKEILKNS